MFQSINQAKYFVFGHTAGINDTGAMALPVCALVLGPALPHHPEKLSPFYCKGTGPSPFLAPRSQGSVLAQVCLRWLSGTTSEPLVKPVLVLLDIGEENQHGFCSDLAG